MRQHVPYVEAELSPIYFHLWDAQVYFDYDKPHALGGMIIAKFFFGKEGKRTRSKTIKAKRTFDGAPDARMIALAKSDIVNELEDLLLEHGLMMPDGIGMIDK